MRPVEPGQLGPAPERYFGSGVWPEGVEDTVLNRWVIDRVGTVHGYYGQPVWFEHGTDSNGFAIQVPIFAYGTWQYCVPCPGTLIDCDVYDCQGKGVCGLKSPSAQELSE